MTAKTTTCLEIDIGADAWGFFILSMAGRRILYEVVVSIQIFLIGTSHQELGHLKSFQ